MILLLPAARCPGCKKPPPLRIPTEERDAALRQPPESVKATVQCPRCARIYVVYARAYQFAA